MFPVHAFFTNIKSHLPPPNSSSLSHAQYLKREKAHVLDEAMKYIKTLQSQLQVINYYIYNNIPPLFFFFFFQFFV